MGMTQAGMTSVQLGETYGAPYKARIAELEAELTWYGEQARLCRLITSDGDAGRQALAADGGVRARVVLTKSCS